MSSGYQPQGPTRTFIVPGSYEGQLPIAPTAPATPTPAPPGAAPALSLGLESINIIIAGDVSFGSKLAGIVVSRR